MPRRHFSAAILSGLLLCAPPAHAGSFLFQWDNDKVADTDRHYTNGMRLALTFDTPGPQLAETGAALARFTLFPATTDLRIGWVLGQDMYTPEEVGESIPDPRDRPYAGWAYTGLTAQREAGQRQDTFELNVGIIGPAAKAGEVQNWFHHLINVAPSKGWSHQIHNEFGLLGTRTVKARSHALDLPGLTGVQVDAIAHATGQLGNVRTGLGGGATLRIGGNLGEDFGPIYGTFALPHKRPDHPTWALYAGAEGRYAAWDVFLDGNTFKESPDVKRTPLVAEARIGASVHWPFDETGWLQGLRVNLNLVERTREFRGQDKNDRYGSLQITLNY